MKADIGAGWSTFVAVLAVFAVALGAPLAVLAADPETLETVLAVWRKREAAAKSLKLVISEVRTDSHATGLEGEAIGGTTKVQRTVILDGTDFRNEQEGEFTDRGSEVPQQLIMTAANDGVRNKRLTRVILADKVIRSIGSIKEAADRIDIRSSPTSPVVRHWRALSPGNEFFKLNALTLVSNKEMLEKIRCLLLQQPYGAAGGLQKFWVAPEQDMAIVRVVNMRGDRMTAQLDANFKSDPKLGWIPASWSWKGYKQDGSVMGTSKATVVSTELDPDVPKVTFDIDWPPGTTVYDSVNRDKFYVPGTVKRK